MSLAQQKIDEIHQTGSAANYIAKIDEWIYHLELSKATKILYIYQHLKGPIKDAIALVPKDTRPTEYKAYCNFVIEIDDCLFERNL
jgi:hypothetical protein